jgi:hypothetical protein
MRKMLISAVVGAATLATASFASVTPAAADVDVYLGTPGVSIGYYNDRCRSYWYRREHPRRCYGYRHYRSGYRDYYYRGRYDARCERRWYRREHPNRCRYYYRHW